jgi:hypothetical protein
LSLQAERRRYFRRFLDRTLQYWCDTYPGIFEMISWAREKERLAKLEAIAQNRTWKGAGNEQTPRTPAGRGVNGHA